MTNEAKGMSAVDVLAVMDDAAATLAKVAQIQMTERADEMREARAAVAELIEAAEYVANYVANYSPLTYSPLACKEANARLRAALARVGGGK